MKSKILFYDREMIIPVTSGIEIRYYGELMYIIYDEPYCSLHFTKNKKILVKVALQFWADNLPEAPFQKCKRSAIINLCYLKGFTVNPPMIEMVDERKITLSKINLLILKDRMTQLPQISPVCPICYPCPEEECKSQKLFCRRKK